VEATTATPKALECKAYGKAGSWREMPLQAKPGRAETPPQEGEQVLDVLERQRLSEGHPQAED